MQAGGRHRFEHAAFANDSNLDTRMHFRTCRGDLLVKYQPLLPMPVAGAKQCQPSSFSMSAAQASPTTTSPFETFSKRQGETTPVMTSLVACCSRGRYYAQVLEGRAEVTGRKLETIRSDLRHVDFKLLVERRVDIRTYDQWSMGYLHDLDLEDRLEALLSEVPVSANAIVDVMERMQPDPVMGALR